MSWLPGFSALANAWYFLLLLPLILFYFLKLKRPRREIPSLALWRQVINDSRVNSPFQRFKRHLLLLLQVLLLLLLVTAAMQPYRRGTTDRSEALPVLIDVSASMAAIDKPGGKTRLALAVQQVEQLIDGLLPDQRLCLISFGQTARKRTPFTSNKRLLRRALAELEIEQTPSDLEDALRLTRALLRTAHFDEVLLISDGNFPTRAHFELPFSLDYRKLAPAGANIGITAVNARLSPKGGWQIFVQIEGSQEADVNASVRLTDGGKLLASERVALVKGGSGRLVFETDGKRAALLQIELTPDGFDALASDNTVHLSLPAARTLLIYLSPELPAFKMALEQMPGISLTDDPGDDPDLAITDDEAQFAIAAPTRLFVGLVPPPLRPLISLENKAGQVVDWDRSAPLLQHVTLRDLVLLQRPIVASGVQPGDYESRGYEVLIDGERGPLLLRHQQGERLTYHLLFHSSKSTLPYRVGFPIMIANLVALARQQAGLSEATPARTGILPGRAATPNATYQVIAPDGGRSEAQASPEGLLSGIPAPDTGVYRIRGAGLDLREGVSLLSAHETTLIRVDKIEFNDELSVTSSAGPIATDQPLWDWLARIAFALMLFEWWYFQRRPRT